MTRIGASGQPDPASGDATAPEAGPGTSYVIFSAGGERFGIAASLVWRVMPVLDLTVVPLASEVLTGLMVLDGEVLAVFDLCAVLGRPSRLVEGGERVIVVGEGMPELGFAVREVEGLVELTDDEITAEPGMEGGASLSRGLAVDGALILCGERLLADGRLTVDHGGGAR